MTAPSFTFRNADTSRGTTAAGETTYEFYHPLLPATVFAAAGYLLILNGWNLNRCMADIVGYDGTVATAVHMLQMRAPREAILPLLSQPGEGNVFRQNALWRYRWKDSTTGECSGLSPISSTTYNVGVETPAGGQTYLGQTAWFYIPTSSKPASADTIQLLACSSGEANVWYIADEKPTGASSYVLLTDDWNDADLINQTYVVTGTPTAQPAGMTWGEGVMPPLVKAWAHPSGRTFYYGVRRFGRYGPNEIAVTVTQGSDLVTIASTVDRTRVVEPGRTGQRVRFYSSITPITNIVDPTVYRLIKTESASTFRVYPELQVSSSLASGATATTWYFAIEDDRDARWTWMSEPNIPWLIDPLKVLAAGDDFDDGVMHWFSTPGTGDLTTVNGSGRIFMQTKRRIYAASGTISDDPSRNTLFTVVASEGTPGFWSGCETPFGWVFLHETRGIRIFDGVVCRPLGKEFDVYGEFKPEDQYQNFEPSMLEEVRLSYDDDNRALIVAHVPLGGSQLNNTLQYATTERNWRGPNRECVSATGKMRSSSTNDVFVTGDPYGNLLVREAQVLDVMPTITGFAGTGTITSVETNRVFSASAVTWDGDSDERVRGSPIWFYDGTYYYFARIVDVIGTHQVELDGPPTREDGTLGTLTTGWTFGVGSIRWSLTTAYIDAEGDPAKPFNVFKVDTRFKRGTTSETFEIGWSNDGDGTFAGPHQNLTTATAPTRDVNGKVHGEMLLEHESAVGQVRARGIARAGHPQITRAVLIAVEKGGALPS